MRRPRAEEISLRGTISPTRCADACSACASPSLPTTAAIRSSCASTAHGRSPRPDPGLQLAQRQPDRYRSFRADVHQAESDTRTSLLSRWPRRRDFLDLILRQLRHLQRSSPLVEVTRREISAEGLNAVSADPAYACAYGLGWRILRHGIEGSPDSEHLWISPTWEIYERWCFVQLGKAIRALEPVYRWSISRNHKSKAIAAFVASSGGQACIELLLQPKFPAGDQRLTAGFQSISGRREPDIVLTRTGRDGPKWYVLDVKYRTTRSNVLDAMASAHIYRDSLRWNERRPERAVLLVPRGGGAPWMEQPDFIRQHHVGVYALSTDTDLGGISQLLSGKDG